ncbi:tyrosine-type recombinase/integrase [Candidatus Woesearchaeota archaeon]|nr:tyrosine-type recombinase/integrase [Candidatus Woesearchaeota archaeon]
MLDSEYNKKVNEMKLKGFSKKTIKTYIFYFEKYKQSNLTRDEFIINMINKNYSENSIRLASAAIKYFIGGNNVLVPKKKKQLPEILSKEEINKMINTLTNLKHRLVIILLYSAGLRVSELINLKVKNINLIDNTIRIINGKGGKDRITILSKKAKIELKKYNLNSVYVFEHNKKKYSEKSILEIIKNAGRKANIKKNVYPHLLRHSFATHLLENGTDIRYIQVLLGHSSVRTTQIYTNVANNSIKKIKSPFD